MVLGVDRAEVDGFVGADHQAGAVGRAPDPEFVVEHHQGVDLLAEVRVERPGVARRGGLSVMRLCSRPQKRSSARSASR